MRCVLIALLWLVLAPGGAARAADFNQAAGAVDRDLAVAQSELARTEKLIKSGRAELTDKVARLEAALKHQKKMLAADQERLSLLQKEKAALHQKMVRESGDLAELAGAVRAAIRDLAAISKTSPLTAEDPERIKWLARAETGHGLLNLETVKKLISLYMAEIKGNGEIKARRGLVVNRAGVEQKAAIARIGGFCTVYQAGDEVGYARPGPVSGRLIALAGEPPWGVRRGLAAFLAGESAICYLDLGRGAALAGLGQGEGLWQRIQSGGPLVWPILLVGLIALVLTAERIIFLQRVQSNTDGLMRRVNELVAKGDFAGARKEAGSLPGRPTSNLILAGLELQGQSPESVESGLSEAMLRELPRLERFLTALKVLAAVAPLLGLLGTVTGMINTFQVITVFGSSDPRLMAGGISEALVTTQLGLGVAIPIMLAAALLSRKAQRITGDMEEKAVALSAALIKERA